MQGIQGIIKSQVNHSMKNMYELYEIVLIIKKIYKKYRQYDNKLKNNWLNIYIKNYILCTGHTAFKVY